MQSLTGKVTGGTLTAAEWNQLPQEVQNTITTLGITLSSGDLNQLGKAIAGYVANGSFYTDSGAADAYSLSTIGGKQAPPGYSDGMLAVFRAGNANTGASTVNVAGLGVKNIKTSAGVDPAAGDIPAGALTTLRYDLANDWFEITGIIPDASTTVKGRVELATQAEVDAGTDTSRAVVPSTLSNAPGVAKAWVNFNGTGTVAIRDDLNVTSITDNGTGNHTVNLGITLSSANACAVRGGSRNRTTTNEHRGVDTYVASTTTVISYTWDATNVLEDYTDIMIAVFANN